MFIVQGDGSSTQRQLRINSDACRVRSSATTRWKRAVREAQRHLTNKRRGACLHKLQRRVSDTPAVPLVQKRAIGVYARAAPENIDDVSGGEPDGFAEVAARLEPRQLHFKQGSPGTVVDALPRSLTRLEHSLILRELVPSQISLDALLEKLCEGTLPVIERFAGTRKMRILVCAGPWLTGLYGIELASALARAGHAVCLIADFDPSAPWFSVSLSKEDEQWFSAQRELWQVPARRETGLANARGVGVDTLGFVPRTLDFYFDLVIDALVGADMDLYGSEKLGDAGATTPDATWSDPIGGLEAAAAAFQPLIQTLSESQLPLISVDVPSGWDVLRGPRIPDIQRDRFLKPEILLCLGTPKTVVRYFGGNYVYLVGDFVPRRLEERLRLRFPSKLRAEGYCLVSVNPYLELMRRQRENAGLPDKYPEFILSWGKANTGELYGHPGEYLATVFAERVQRQWVDVDASPDLWDEID
jgi:NAD(P)H-hydrate repair Nnr-like enzyme with NAD(P)H-hydrate epimerase domain